MDTLTNPTVNLIERAHSAYFKNPELRHTQPSLALSRTVTLDGRRYVVVRNSLRILAVYRYRATQNQLKLLKRIPTEILES